MSYMFLQWWYRFAKRPDVLSQELKAQDSSLDFWNRSGIWQAHRQQCCRDVYQISESDTIFTTINLALRDFTRFGSKTSTRLVNRGPEMKLHRHPFVIILAYHGKCLRQDYEHVPCHAIDDIRQSKNVINHVELWWHWHATKESTCQSWMQNVNTSARHVNFWLRKLSTREAQLYHFGDETMSHYVMMTSSNRNIFRVIGYLCGEFTGDRWIPHTKASDAELWCFLWSAPEQTVEKIMVRMVIWDAVVSIMTSFWCKVLYQRDTCVYAYIHNRYHRAYFHSKSGTYNNI